MKYIKTIPMCGGLDKAFHCQIERGAHIIDHFYFCTDEGISTHRSEEHMRECLEESDFMGFLDMKAKALPLAHQICRLEGLPVNDMVYLCSKAKLWAGEQ